MDRRDRVAAPPGWEEPSILLAEELAASKVVSCVTGGATRAESVRAALAEVPDEALVVLVHDAARPLVDDAVVERVLAPLAEGFDGAVPGAPGAPTRSSGCDGRRRRGDGRPRRLSSALRRRRRSSPIRSAARIAGDLAGATDCASLVERAGGRVAVVEGDPRLLKVTTPDDLALVESWL